MENTKIVVSVTHLKNMISLAEENAMKNPGLSPLLEIELMEKEPAPLLNGGDKIRIKQLPYSFNEEPVLIGR